MILNIGPKSRVKRSLHMNVIIVISFQIRKTLPPFLQTKFRFSRYFCR